MKSIFRYNIEINNIIRINLFDINIIFRYNLIYIFMNFMKKFENKLFYFKDFIVWNINAKFNFDIFDNIVRIILRLLLNSRKDEIVDKLRYCLLMIGMIDIKTRMIWHKEFDQDWQRAEPILGSARFAVKNVCRAESRASQSSGSARLGSWRLSSARSWLARAALRVSKKNLHKFKSIKSNIYSHSLRCK